MSSSSQEAPRTRGADAELSSGTRLAAPAMGSRVLVTGADRFLQKVLTNRLSADGHLVITCAPGPRLGSVVERMHIDVVIVHDVSPTFPSGRFLAPLLRAHAPPLVLLSERRFVEHLRRGRMVVLLPPFQVDLVAAVIRGLSPPGTGDGR